MAEKQNSSKASQIKERRGIKYWPETERPREKLLHLGPEGLSDGELLAVLLRIGSTGQSAEELGRQLKTQYVRSDYIIRYYPLRFDRDSEQSENRNCRHPS